MRLSEWLSNKKLVKASAELRRSETFTMLMQMLEEESPLNLPLAAQGPTGDDRSHRLGLIEGYNQCLRIIRQSGSLPILPPEPIRARYAPPEE